MKWIQQKSKQNNGSNLYPICTVCIQIWNNVAQGSSLRPETPCCSLGFLFHCNQLNYWPPSLKVTGQLMRYSSVPFMHVLTVTSFIFQPSQKSSLLSFRSCVSLDLIMIFLISKPFHPYLPTALLTITPALRKWHTHGLRNRIAKLQY